jgi:hypothetical protein
MQCIARYEIMWEREVSLTEEITKAWQSDLVVQNLEIVTTSHVHFR